MYSSSCWKTPVFKNIFNLPHWFDGCGPFWTKSRTKNSSKAPFWIRKGTPRWWTCHKNCTCNLLPCIEKRQWHRSQGLKWLYKRNDGEHEKTAYFTFADSFLVHYSSRAPNCIVVSRGIFSDVLRIVGAVEIFTIDGALGACGTHRWLLEEKAEKVLWWKACPK